jgi:NAD(P)-dependent dehydrogenase (short-subunit alcohol dehydrogenase family)
MTASMNGEICVVTGATSGIGRATALGLARLGARVVIIARNPAKAAEVVAEIKKLPGALEPEVVLADLTEMEQVRRASDEIRTRFDHVDVLINNAGGMFDTYHESSEGIEDANAVNHLAVFLLTLSLHSSLKRAAHPRVVIVSSNIHEKAPYVGDYGSLLKPKYVWSRIYAQTKLRNMVFTRALSDRWKAEGITVNSLHPGVVDTGLMSGWENRWMKALFKVVQVFFISPEEGARTSLFLASDPSVAKVTGEYFSKSRPHPYNRLADELPIQQQLWDESLSFLKAAGIAQDPQWALHSQERR